MHGRLPIIAASGALVAAAIMLLLQFGRGDSRGPTVATPVEQGARTPVLRSSPSAEIRTGTGPAVLPAVVVADVVAVHDATGALIRDAEVEALDAQMVVVSRARTEAAGRAKFEAPGAVSVRVRHAKFHEAQAVIRMAGGSASPLRVELAGRGSLSLSVLDGGKEGVPLQGALVELDLLASGPRSRVGPLRTDALGTVEFRSLPLSDAALVRVHQPGFRSQVRRLDVREGGDLTVELQPVSSLRLSVELVGFESTTLPQQRITIFARTLSGELEYIDSLDLLLRAGRATTTLEWTRGAVNLVGQIKCIFDDSRMWEVEAPVEPSEVRRTSPRQKPEQDDAREAIDHWQTALRFENLGEGIRLRFLTLLDDSQREAVADKLVHYAQEGTELHGALVTDATGRVAVPVPQGVEGRFRFWLQRPGLVSQVLDLRPSNPESDVLLGRHGGDLRVRGWRGSPALLTADELTYGSSAGGSFEIEEGGDLVGHFPPGRYRLNSGRTRLGGFDHVVKAGSETIVDLARSSDAVILGRVTSPDEEVELLRATSHVDRPSRFEITRSQASGDFVFPDLPAGSYVVTHRSSEGALAWRAVEVAESEIVDVGDLGQIPGHDVEISLLYDGGRPARDQGVVLWEAPKNAGVSLRLSPDAEGRIRCRLPGQGDVALFGSGWGAVLPARTTPLTLRLPAPGSEAEAVVFAPISRVQREVIVLCRGALGVVGLVRRVGAHGVVQVPRALADSAEYAWDEGWGFYRIESRLAERPKPVLIPPQWIPSDSHSCRVVLVGAGGMSLLPLGWSRSYELPSSATTDGLQLHAAPGWDLQLDFLGGAGRSLRLVVRANGATITGVVK